MQILQCIICWWHWTLNENKLSFWNSRSTKISQIIYVLLAYFIVKMERCNIYKVETLCITLHYVSSIAVDAMQWKCKIEHFKVNCLVNIIWRNQFFITYNRNINFQNLNQCNWYLNHWMTSNTWTIQIENCSIIFRHNFSREKQWIHGYMKMI